MPTYRYRCAKCGDELEVWQSFDEKPKSRHNGGCGGKLDQGDEPCGHRVEGLGLLQDRQSFVEGERIEVERVLGVELEQVGVRQVRVEQVRVEQVRVEQTGIELRHVEGDQLGRLTAHFPATSPAPRRRLAPSS